MTEQTKMTIEQLDAEAEALFEWFKGELAALHARLEPRMTALDDMIEACDAPAHLKQAVARQVFKRMGALADGG